MDYFPQDNTKLIKCAHCEGHGSTNKLCCYTKATGRGPSERACSGYSECVCCTCGGAGKVRV